MLKKLPLSLLLYLLLLPSGGAVELYPTFIGDQLSLLWSIPFVGMILSIALLPLLFPALWYENYGKITLVWVSLLLLPLTLIFGVGMSAHLVIESLLTEFIPFVLLLLVLYTASSGIHFTSTFQASPKVNLLILSIGTLLASLMGTTGAAMLLIRPLLEANKKRRYKAHVIIFFIYLVGNVGGALTPLGDPPLFLGFINGIDFFWTFKYMLGPYLMTAGILLFLLFLLDSYLFTKEFTPPPIEAHRFQLTIEGWHNIFIILGVLGGIVISGFWQSKYSLTLLYTSLPLEDLMRNGLFLFLAILSFYSTKKIIHQKNHFNWYPLIEVSKLFLGIFITIIPVILILQAGEKGALHAIVNVTHTPQGEPINSTYFWIIASLSAFLDNAPTYLVFFNMAGSGSGELEVADYLMNQIPQTLLAISIGTIFTGPLTYIANAPNLLIKTIAEQEGVVMPSFFSYFYQALIIFIPIYVLLIFVFL